MRTWPSAALVTGASSGIGEAFARVLPGRTSLLLTGRNLDALRALAAAVSAPGREVDAVAADLSTDAGLDDVAARAAAFGIDLLILNAGTGRYGDFLQVPEVALREMVAVNLLAPAVLAHRLLPGMLTRARDTGGRAGLIVVSSATAFAPVPRLAVYAASKAFDLSLAEALAAELAGEPVDVLALCPSATRTRFAERSGWRGGSEAGCQRGTGSAGAAADTGSRAGKRHTAECACARPWRLGPGPRLPAYPVDRSARLLCSARARLSPTMLTYRGPLAGFAAASATRFWTCATRLAELPKKVSKPQA
jgi:short-subunit dehydrogenase